MAQTVYVQMTTVPPLIRVGSTDPASGLGNNNDIYIRNTNGNWWQKLSGVWVAEGSFLGPTGPTGSVGPTGPSGAAATIAVGTVTTGAAGSSVTIVNGGSSSAAVFNFTIPRGDTGATGATGTTGYTPAFIVASGGPGGGTGNNADLYLDSGTGNVYGPKASGAWGGIVCNFKGPQGIGYNPRGAWDGTTTYAQGDMVTESGSIYYALQASLNLLPSGHGAYWQVAGSSYPHITDSGGIINLGAFGSPAVVYITPSSTAQMQFVTGSGNLYMFALDNTSAAIPLIIEGSTVGLYPTGVNTLLATPTQILIPAGVNIGIGTVTPQRPLTIGWGTVPIFVIEMSPPAGFGSTTVVAGGSLTASTTYYYKMTALDGFGETVGGSQGTATTTSSNKTVNLAWAACPGASSYKIYRSTTSGVYGATSLAGTVTSASFSDTGVTLTTGTPPAVTSAYVVTINGSGTSWFNGGNVGIGTTNPTQKLQVESGNLWMRDSTNDAAVFITVNVATGAATVDARNYAWSASIPLILNPGGGLVGIGVSPTLAVLQTTGAVGNATAMFGSGNTGVSFIQANPGILFNSYFGGNWKSMATGPGGTIVVECGTTGDMVFSTAASVTGTGTVQPMTEKLRITNGGNVGIGTSSPTGGVFQINSEFNITIPSVYLYEPTASWGTSTLFNSYRYIVTNSAATDGNWKGFQVGAGGVAIGYTTTPIYGSTDALYINGNVGIGTQTPGGVLALTPSVGLNKILVYDGVNDKYGFGIASNTLQIYSGAGATTNATIAFGKSDGTTFTQFMQLKNGNLGIGTTTAQGRCQITGASQSYTNAGIFNITTGTGASTDENIWFGILDGNYSYIQAIKQGTAFRPILLNPSGGAIGIGVTTAPSYTLHMGIDSAGKPSTSTWTVTSDARTKQKILTMTDDAVSVLNKLRWIRYQHNGLANTPAGSSGMGLSAQEIRPHFPEAVRSVKGKLQEADEQDTDILGIDYHQINVLTALAIQQIDARLKKAGL